MFFSYIFFFLSLQYAAQTLAECHSFQCPSGCISSHLLTLTFLKGTSIKARGHTNRLLTFKPLRENKKDQAQGQVTVYGQQRSETEWIISLNWQVTALCCSSGFKDWGQQIKHSVYLFPLYPSVISPRVVTFQRWDFGMWQNGDRWRSSRGTNMASPVWLSPPTANILSVWETSMTWWSTSGHGRYVCHIGASYKAVGFYLHTPSYDFGVFWQFGKLCLCIISNLCV